MAQLNPNFEIDFDDINSYEQIQLINDTQLAKENLLMHKAYKEPAEDEIIRNQFSSFTFVDFCPKLFNTASKSSLSDKTKQSTTNLRHHQYMLETFSDLFNRINLWLKVNRDWRVISMETLIFDCASQFNHLKSSFHSSTLPRNMRGLRLYLSPTKSRFSGPQKIGCINVIPRKLSGHHQQGSSTEPIAYETLDKILARLNELLLTRPIEGRILSVETITLPIVNGYVNTETNYFMDNRLNALSQRIYSHASDGGARARSTSLAETTQQDEKAPPAASPVQMGTVGQGSESGGGGGGCRPQQSAADTHAKLASLRAPQPNGLIDTLRVYYEFGPMVCGLVNLIDFLPRFNLRQPVTVSASNLASPSPDRDLVKAREPDKDELSLSSLSDDQRAPPAQATPVSPTPAEYLDIDSTESLTRLIGRSLNWFEGERKRVLVESTKVVSSQNDDNEHNGDSSASSDTESSAKSGQQQQQQTLTGRKCQEINLKMCNLKIHTKVLLKSRLFKVTPQNALEMVQSRQMFHEPPKEPIVCHQCGLSSLTHELHAWCAHLLELNQPFELKFARLAYVVPVRNEYVARFTRSLRSLPSFGWPTCEGRAQAETSQDTSHDHSQCSSDQHDSLQSQEPAGDSSKIIKAENCTGGGEVSRGQSRSSQGSSKNEKDDTADEGDENDDEDEDGERGGQEGEDDIDILLAAHASAEQLAKEASLEIVHATNLRHQRNERLHQLNEDNCLDYGNGTSASSPEPGQLIGQLTYRLFAPCQLVNSSSCFSINPVNSSNPLARRGSVVSDGGSCSDNATPSTLLLPAGNGGGGFLGDSLNGSTLTINSSQQQQQQQQAISFGAFFPALSHDTILGTHHHQRLGLSGQQHGGKSSNSHRFATNEFEPVEAIRRRMEVYVTTNSMKVLAGETLVVNLSDHLSCLSNAIEQTVVKASFSASRQPSTWVSVYILYAAVDEPHLPSQLLEQQRLRERLQLISEADEDEQQQKQQQQQPLEEMSPAPAARTGEQAKGAEQADAEGSLGEHNMVPVFDDDFKCEQQSSKDQDQTPAGAPVSRQQRIGSVASQSAEQKQSSILGSTLASLNLENGSIRVELSRSLGHQTDLPPYNSAYDRTVALPTQPDDHLTNYLEPVDLNMAGSWALQQQQQQAQPAGAGNVWLDESDLTEVHAYQLSDSNVRDASKLLRQRQQQAEDGAELRSSTPLGRGRKEAKGERKRRSRTRRPGEHSQCSVM